MHMHLYFRKGQVFIKLSINTLRDMARLNQIMVFPKKKLNTDNLLNQKRN